MTSDVTPCPKTGLPMTPILPILDSYIDYNGHLNMGYYIVMFDSGLDHIFASWGFGPNYVKETGYTFFATDCMTRYRHEVHQHDPVRVRGRILGVDDKRVHYFSELVHDETGKVMAVCEAISLHIDLSIRRVAAFPPEARAKFEAQLAEHAKLGWPELASHRIGLPKKASN